MPRAPPFTGYFTVAIRGGAEDQYPSARTFAGLPLSYSGRNAAHYARWNGSSTFSVILACIRALTESRSGKRSDRRHESFAQPLLLFPDPLSERNFLRQAHRGAGASMKPFDLQNILRG